MLWQRIIGTLGRRPWLDAIRDPKYPVCTVREYDGSGILPFYEATVYVGGEHTVLHDCISTDKGSKRSEVTPKFHDPKEVESVTRQYVTSACQSSLKWMRNKNRI